MPPAREEDSDSGGKKRKADEQLTNEETKKIRDGSENEAKDSKESTDGEKTSQSTSLPKAGQDSGSKAAGTDSTNGGEKEKDQESVSGNGSKGDDDDDDKGKVSSLEAIKADDDKKEKNPFASAFAKSSGGTSVFGSGFGSSATGFGSATSGSAFGFGKKSEGSSIFGGGSKVSGFGAASSSTTASSIFATNGKGVGGVFGKKNTQDDPNNNGKKEEETAATPAAVLPEEVELKNGEEGQECVFEVRAKAFVLEEEEEDKKQSTQQTNSGPIPMSVRPTLSTGPIVASSNNNDKDKKQTPPDAKEKKKDDNDDDKTGDDKALPTKEPSKPTKWRELGIGPLRVLRRKDASGAASSRVVQRRESAPGGMGTKLLVNVRLQKECKLTRPSERHVQLASIEETGRAAVNLFKVRNAVDAKNLEEALTNEIESAASCVKE